MRTLLLPNWLTRGILLLSAILLMACETAEGPSVTSKEVEGNPGWVIKLQTSGGFAGVHEMLVISSKGMTQFTNQKTSRKFNQTTPERDLDELAKLLKNLSSAPKTVLGDRQCRDCFNHVIEITQAGKSRVIRTNSLLDPDEPVAQLLKKLNQLKSALIKQAPASNNK